MDNIIQNTEKLDFDKVWLALMETRNQLSENSKNLAETRLILDEKFKETNEKFKETDEKFKETDEKFKETRMVLDRKFNETAKRFLETERMFKEIHGELGGIGKSNGKIAQDYFYGTLSKNMKLGELEFDFIDSNLRRKKKNTEAEYDIILYNQKKVLVVEVKYIFRLEHLPKFYETQLKRFRLLFEDYKNYKLYGAIAAMTFEDGVIEEAQKFGFYVITQFNENMQILNQENFKPKAIK